MSQIPGITAEMRFPNFVFGIEVLRVENGSDGDTTENRKNFTVGKLGF